MKTKNIEIIDGYKIVVSISAPTIDPEETKNKINSILSLNPDIKETKTEEDLYTENAVFYCGPNQELVEDQEGSDLQTILNTLGDHKKLLSTGEKINDWRNTEYWVKNQVWEKKKIEILGKTIPKNGILEENLNKAQREEMAEEKETRRISKLTPDEKVEEKQNRISALKREAVLLKNEADIVGEEFDAPAWFQTQKEQIEGKYA
ncbi:MAG: hypothetical protein LBG07_02935 [Treponema sp.]|jgi:hypothetical protein|nr:hypothetical protein [Treponema sp.]